MTVRIAFLFDTTSAASDVELRLQSLCLACTRVLLSFSVFPNTTRMKYCKWNYFFFNDHQLTVAKIPRFLEVNATLIDSMFRELRWALQSNAKVKQMSLSVLSSTLSDVLQGSTWDSPDILSPPKVAKKVGMEGWKWGKSVHENELQNLIFVCSPWPGPAAELPGNLFSSDVFTRLSKLSIKVFWLYEGDLTSKNKTLMRVFEAVALTGGRVINLSSFLAPAPPKNLLPCPQASFKNISDSQPHLLLCEKETQEVCWGQKFHSVRDEKFTADSLLLWHPFVQCIGASTSFFKDLNELQNNSRSRYSRQKTLSKLLKAVSSHPQSNEEEIDVVIPGDQMDTMMIGHLQEAANVDEIILIVKSSYNEQVLCCIEGAFIHEWISKVLHKLQLNVERKYLFSTVHKSLLLSPQQLENKYMYGEGTHISKQKVTEYQLQVLLRLEVCQLCGSHLCESEFSLLSSQVSTTSPRFIALHLPVSEIANVLPEGGSLRQYRTCAGISAKWSYVTRSPSLNAPDIPILSPVTDLLRKISLLAKPALLGCCMKEVIIPNYSTSCQKILLNVCEELMLPIPVELGENLISTSHGAHAEASCNSTFNGERSNKHSLQEVRSMHPATHRLVRCASFQDQRQITVTTQKQRVKKGEMKESTESTRKTDFSGPGISSSNSESSKVCRTLFSRSLSVDSDIGFKRPCVEDNTFPATKRRRADFVVKETPLKKQVENYRQFKLQRLRLKTDVISSQQVEVIEESPRRSFYSSKLPAVSTIHHTSRKRPSPGADELNLVVQPPCIVDK